MDTPRVLIVDDDDWLRASLEEQLTARGFAVRGVRTGEDALSCLRKEDFDVVLLDQVLPGMEGLQVLDQIVEFPSPPAVVLLTAVRGQVPTAVSAMKRGAVDYIEKPCDIDALEHVLRGAWEKYRLREEVTALKGALARRSIPPLTCHSPPMLELLRLIQKCAPTDSTVLIQGETGTGKELVAHEIYSRSMRAGRPFMPVNCGALPEQLLESELFGHERGAFTGAGTVRHGIFEVAEQGTIFLDEIGEMHPNTQVKLLRVLQSGEVRRVGGNRVSHVDVRVIASTNKDLAREVGRGTFREDLFYRLSVLTLRVPPLRERREEIPYLVEEFLATSCARLRIKPKEFDDEALNVLMNHHWPGNVRELGNVVELAVVLSEGAVIRAADLPPSLLLGAQSGAPDSPLSLEQVEAEHILRVLRMNHGNKRKTARDLGIDTKTLYNKLRRLNLGPAETAEGEPDTEA